MAREEITGGLGVVWSTIKAKLNNMFTEIYAHFTSNNLVLHQIAPAGAPTVSINTSTGNLTGTYYYAVTFVTAEGETEAVTDSGAVSPVSQQINLSAIPVSADNRVIGRKIYRTYVGAVDQRNKKLVATISDNVTTSYTDNVADANLGDFVPYINTTGGAQYVNSDRAAVQGVNSTAYGVAAMPLNTGYANTAIGANSLHFNTIGLRNVAIGTYALYKNTTGYGGTAVGVHALNENTEGIANTAIGYAALFNNIDGDYNVSIGNAALTTNTTGNENTAVGSQALNLNTSGLSNTAIGYAAAQKNTTGQSNTAVGKYALANNQTGHFNVAIGQTSLNTATNQNGNVGVGFQTLFATTGAKNVALGYGAGRYETGSNKLYIDNDTRASEADAKLKSLIYGVFATTTEAQSLTVNAGLTWRPKTAVTPANNGELTFELTSDTSLTIKVKGSDGTVRSAVLALAP